MKTLATIGDDPYTGFDDVLIPEPSFQYDKNMGQPQPWEIYSERFEFTPVADALVKTPENWGLEIRTRVYITHTPEDRNTTPKHRAESWIKKISSIQKANYRFIEQGTVKLPGVPPIPMSTPIEAYRFTLESNGSGVLD